MPYASVDSFRDYIRQAGITAQNEQLIADVLERATDLIDLELGVSFSGYESATTRVVRAYGATTLWLPPHQVPSVSAVSWQGYAVTEYTEQASGHLYRAAGWGVGEYVVTANWGYGTPPPAVVELCLEVAINIWREKDRASFTDVIGVEGAGDTRVAYKRAFTNRQQRTIDNLKSKYLSVVV